MVKHYLTQNIFKYTWDQVAVAFWQRYPNPNSKHVLSEDTLSREVINGKLITKRLLTKTNKLPKWGERFMPGSSRRVCILEESIMDIKKKTLVTYTRNIAMTRIMSVDEKCCYQLDPENFTRTRCDREAWVSSGVYGFARAIQAFGMERFKQNVSRTVKGFEFILEKLYAPRVLEVTETRTDKLRTTAKKATEIAQAGKTMVATCAGQTAT